MKTRDVVKLMVRLTPDEQRQRGVDLAEARRELDKLSLEKADVVKRIKAQEEKIDTLTSTVHYCQELRPVEVEYRPDLDADTMTEIRLDTMEVVSIRQLDGNERRELREPVLAVEGKTMDAGSEEPAPATDTSTQKES